MPAQLVQAAGADPVGAALVLLHLLVGDAEERAETLLADAAARGAAHAGGGRPERRWDGVRRSSASRHALRLARRPLRAKLAACNSTMKLRTATAASKPRSSHGAWRRANEASGRAPGRTVSMMPVSVQAEPRADAAIGVGDHRDAGVGGADQRQALLDRAHPRHGEMLVGAGAAAEPGIVGDVHQPGGPVAGCGGRSRERPPRSRSAGSPAAGPAAAA